MSKRRSQWLSVQVAKRLKLCSDIQQHINSFNLKPRNFYDYVHGRKHRHPAYALCLLSLIHAKYMAGNPSSPGYKINIPRFILNARDSARKIQKLHKIGIRFSASAEIIWKQSVVFSDLTSALYFARCHDCPHYQHLAVFRNYQYSEWNWTACCIRRVSYVGECTNSK